MKPVLFTAICSVILFGAAAQQNILSKKTTVFLVRHAEKDTGTNPRLTVAGMQRAGALLHALQNKNLQRIYVTQYQRTQMTGDSLHLQLHIDTVHYLADSTGSDLFSQIKQHHDEGENILVIGHTTTLPVIIKKLGVAKPLPYIADNEFDNLFELTQSKGRPVLQIEKYGTKALTAPYKNAMKPLQ